MATCGIYTMPVGAFAADMTNSNVKTLSIDTTVYLAFCTGLGIKELRNYGPGLCKGKEANVLMG